MSADPYYQSTRGMDNSPIHIPWRLCTLAVSTLRILPASTVRTGVDSREGMISKPQFRLWEVVSRTDVVVGRCKVVIVLGPPSSPSVTVRRVKCG